jgi:hypothetical protein
MKSTPQILEAQLDRVFEMLPKIDLETLSASLKMITNWSDGGLVYDFSESIGRSEGMASLVETIEIQTALDVHLEWEKYNAEVWLRQIVTAAMIAGYHAATVEATVNA